MAYRPSREVPDETWKEPEVTPPPDVEPNPRDARLDRRVDESDPTGMRAMLSALPDPGPMPADLVHRISISLAAEQARHGSAQHAPDKAGHTGGGTLHPLAASRERRASLGRRLPALAVAASIVVLAGAVILGVLAMNSGLGMTAGDATAESAVSDARVDQGGDAGAAEPFGTSESAPQADGSDETRALTAAGAPILATGAFLTSASLVDHARTVRDRSTALGNDAEAERDMATSSVGTPEGAADCLSGLLGITPEEASGLVDAVDFVDFDGTSAALILAHDSAPDPSPAAQTETRTAYLVPLDCGPRGAVPLHDPVRIDS